MIEGTPKPGTIVYARPDYDPADPDAVDTGVDTAMVVVGRWASDRLYVVGLKEFMGNEPAKPSIQPVDFEPEDCYSTQAAACRAEAEWERVYAAKCIRLAEALERVAGELEGRRP